SARELLKANQPGSGTDLASMLIEVYETAGEQLNDESRGRLTQLIALTGPDGSWRDTLISKAIAWSAKASGCPAGDPELHYYVGELLYKGMSSHFAESHLLASGTHDSALLLAQLLVEWSHSGSDPGLFAARGVMPYLLTTNILAARTFLDKFMSLILAESPDLLLNKEPVPTGDGDEIWATNNHTLNFLQMAVRICQRANPEAASKEARNMWVRLCGRYAGGVGLTNISTARVLIAGGNEMKDAVSSISQIYFNIEPPRNAPINPLGDMMAALMGGGPKPAGSKPKKLIGPGRGRGRGTTDRTISGLD
ncbi:hypothetical protein FRB99_002590, partial [Tulasnella sp. 403]